MHKLIVTSLRPVSRAAKARKDVIQAEQVLRVLLADRPADVRRAHGALRERGAGWAKHFKEGVARLPEVVRALLKKSGGA